MNEYTIVWQSCLAMVVSGLCAGLYSLGGRKWKAWRRWFASLLFTATFCLIAYWHLDFSWWLLLLYPGLLLQYSLGYGDDDVTARVRMRLGICLVMLINGIIAGIVLGISLSNITVIVIIQALVGIASVVFAVKNPFQAAFEEAFVCMITTMPLMGYLFVH